MKLVEVNYPNLQRKIIDVIFQKNEEPKEGILILNFYSKKDQNLK